MRHFKAVCLVLGITFFSVTFSFAGPSDEKKSVTLGPAADIAGMPVSKQDIKDPAKKAAAQVKSVSFSLDAAACFIFPAPEGYDYLDVNGLKPEGKPGSPQVPMKTFVVEIEKDAQVVGVEVVKGKFSAVKEDVNLVPVPEPSTYTASPEGGMYVTDKEIYGQEASFPGKLISYDIGRDNEKQYVFVRLFPAQVTPKHRKVQLLTEATINVYYGYGDTTKTAAGQTQAQGKPQPPGPGPGPGTTITSTTAQSVIIAPASLLTQANILMNVHVGEGISSAVVTTEDIDASYAAAEDPSYNGYNNSNNTGWRNIKNYNYVLAKKIVSYLRDAAAHPNLVYVTLIGDGLLVPPSYYIYDADVGFDNNPYARWVPTDLYYASPDYDYVPNYRVGRLPVSNSAEAQAMVNKIAAWYAAANWSWFGKAFVVGGDPHTNHVFCGEMNIEETLNQEYLSGMNIVKCFVSDGEETKINVEPAIKDGNTGLVYHIGHGNGNGISLDGNSFIHASEVLAYPTTVANVPIFVSAACYNGAFDTDLYPPKFWDVPYSFGEALLKSKAGAIAYFGGVRLNDGDALFHYDLGNVVVTKETGCLGLYNYAFASYHQGADDLGKLYIDAVANFVANNDMSGYNTLNTDNVFLFVFLGDPALKIPPQQAVTEYAKAVDTAVNPAGYDDDQIPQYTSPPVTVTATTNSPTVMWKLLDPVARTVLEANTVDYGPNFSRTFSPSAQQQYLVRTSTQNAVPSVDYTKEGWLFYGLNAGAGTVMHISDIAMAIVGNRNKNATATVTVVNQGGAPVPGAVVSGHWSGLTTDTDSGTTNANGQVVLSSDTVPRGTTGTFTFCVDDVNLAGATYDPQANTMTCNSISLYAF